MQGILAIIFIGHFFAVTKVALLTGNFKMLKRIAK